MSEDTPSLDITKKRLVYDMPGADAVIVRQDIEFRGADGQPLTIDLYVPPGSQHEARLPAIVVVVGYPDTGTRLGCKFKQMEWSASWGRLIAATGMVAVMYTNREPKGDLQALLHALRENAGSLGIDETRIGLMAASGNVPLALWMLMEDQGRCLKCATLCYGYMLDLEGAAVVAEAARTFGFVNPASGKSVDDLPQHVPLLVVRSGRDEPHLNETIDQFLTKALARDLPVTLVNHADAPHGFDLFHDSETSREIIRQMLAFMRFSTLASAC